MIILEREQAAGGLARTFTYDGYRFDIGPHRFHTHDPVIDAYIRQILGDTARFIGRSSSVFFQNRYFRWPLGPDALYKLPLSIGIKILRDLAGRHRSPVDTGESFQDYVIAKYGYTLYDLFFKQYTEKFAFVGCDRLHCSWATASVDRAIIDRRIRMSGLADVFRMALLPRLVRTEFIYPDGGCGRFCDLQRDRITALGGRILTGVPDVGLTRNGNRIEAVRNGTEEFPVSHLVWTAPLPRLCACLKLDPPPLNYMNTAVFNFMLSTPLRRRDQWIYFSSRNIIFARISSPAAFDPGNIPTGRGGLCVEVMCHEPDWWRDPGRLTDRVIGDLAATGMCSASEIEDCRIEKVPETYPVYTIDYPRLRRETMARLGRFVNLHPTGRCGAFFYNNMDDSVRMGLEVAEKLAS